MQEFTLTSQWPLSLKMEGKQNSKIKSTPTWRRAVVLWSGTFSLLPSSSFLPLDSIFLISLVSKIYLSMIGHIILKIANNLKQMAM